MQILPDQCDRYIGRVHVTSGVRACRGVLPRWGVNLDAQLSYEAFEGGFGQSPVPGKVVPLSALTAVEDVVLLGQPPRLQGSACGVVCYQSSVQSHSQAAESQAASCKISPPSRRSGSWKSLSLSSMRGTPGGKKASGSLHTDENCITSRSENVAKVEYHWMVSK